MVKESDEPVPVRLGSPLSADVSSLVMQLRAGSNALSLRKGASRPRLPAHSPPTTLSAADRKDLRNHSAVGKLKP